MDICTPIATYSLPYLVSGKFGCHKSLSFSISTSTRTISRQFSWRNTFAFLFILFLIPGMLQANRTKCVNRSVRLLPRCLMTWKQGLSFLITLEGGFLSHTGSTLVSGVTELVVGRMVETSCINFSRSLAGHVAGMREGGMTGSLSRRALSQKRELCRKDSCFNICLEFSSLIQTLKYLIILASF